MRYFIEGFRSEGSQVLGNCDGQAALGEMRNPKRSARWRRIKSNPREKLSLGGLVTQYNLVDETGRILETCCPWSERSA